MVVCSVTRSQDVKTTGSRFFWSGTPGIQAEAVIKSESN